MKPFQKFSNITLDQKELLEIYLELRLYFQELGWSEEDLSDPPNYTGKLMSLFHRFNDKKDDLFNLIRRNGFSINWDDFLGHVTPLLSKINEITPLNNGSKKRDDNGDEDN